MSNSQRKLRANAIRFLSMDAVQKANSGHPGMPMGMADIAEVLWHDFLNHNPSNPDWFNRDRFVLSNGHGSMLLYSLLHLTGYALTIEDLQQFRQLHSKTPGHPEHGETPGVETTTGPLGQGLANAVGMAIAETQMAASFNRPGFDVVDHYTYCFVGDGDLMEGVSHEASSFAGTLGLGKLIVLYDDNQISIDGDIEPWFSEDTAKRYEAYGWQVISEVDGHDSDAIAAAIRQAQAETNKPTLICCKTVIGWGSPSFAGSAKTHGAALGAQEIAEIRQHLQWPYPAFSIPNELYADWDARRQGQEHEQAWQAKFVEYQQQYPELAAEFLRRVDGNLPDDWQEHAERLVRDQNQKQQNVATRKSSQAAIDYFANYLPELVGGSADLTESNCTNWNGMTVYSKEQRAGRYLHYGVREFGMSAIMNGMALYKGILPFGGTFLTFSDYARNAVRLSALMKLRMVYVYSHDSIGLGEDGPTHQPVEHLASLRMMPGLGVWRPCDTVETAVAWQSALGQQWPSCIVTSRQSLAFQQRSDEQIANIAKGGYVLRDHADGQLPDVILIATGSEVELAVKAADKLKENQIFARVVSMPCVEVFLQQDKAYQSAVLPESVEARVAIEAASRDYWYRFVGLKGAVIGLDQFGLSAPANEIFEELGFTVDHVAATAKEVIYAVASATHHFHAKCAAGSVGTAKS